VAYTTADLLASVSRLAFIPAGQVTFSDAEILAIADEETQTKIMPRLMAIREEYFVYPYSTSIVQGQRLYAVPSRSIGGMVREVRKVNSNGTYYDLERIEPEDVQGEQLGTPRQFYLEGESVALYPTPSATQETLQISFYIEQGKLVDVTQSGVISNIDTNTKIVTLATIPSTWATNDLFDFAAGRGNQAYKGIDSQGTVSSNTIQFPSLPETLAVGDYVTQAETSALVQLPRNMRAVLAQFTAARLLEAQNQPGADKMAETAVMSLEAAIRMLSPRVKGASRTLTPDLWF
jgi:hypothetical protein